MVLSTGGEMLLADDIYVEAATREPGRLWSLRSEDGLDLSFEALGPPAELGEDEPVARAGGIVGYEQLCRVTGVVPLVGPRRHEVSGAGQRGHVRREPDWDRIEAMRTLSAWLEDGTGLAFVAVRPAGARDHETEARWASLLAPAGGLRVDDPRISITYDKDRYPRSVGLELWVGEDDAYPRRATGTLETLGRLYHGPQPLDPSVVQQGAALLLGARRLDPAVVHWRMDGRSGVGRYDVLRRA
jgi:hypothetical protein